MTIKFLLIVSLHLSGSGKLGIEVKGVEVKGNWL